ncbi:MAG: ComF family protein [Halioglobus sp.]
MVNKITATVLANLFPHYCILCGLHSRQPVPLCLDCQGGLQANHVCCRRCAIPLPPLPDNTTLRVCGACLQSPPAFQRVIAPWLYDEQLAYIIHQWKYHGATRLTPLLASLWLRHLSNLTPVDLIIPVPLHWRRLWHRGFNQSDLLCQQLCSRHPALAPSMLERRLVRRVRATAAQSASNAKQRASNLRGAFTVCRPCDNLRIAIVDDVLTTGATASAMAGTLRAAGASHIEVWCLARTPAPGP